MKCAIIRKIENDRSEYDLMDCNHAQNWGNPEQWDWTTSNQDDQRWTQQEPPQTPTHHPTDVNYMNSTGKGKGDWNSAGAKCPDKPSNSVQYYMATPMKAMKGGRNGCLQIDSFGQVFETGFIFLDVA